MKALKGKGRMEPKSHTSMSRPHPNRANKLRVDKKADRKMTKDQIIEDLLALDGQEARNKHNT